MFVFGVDGGVGGVGEGQLEIAVSNIECSIQYFVCEKFTQKIRSQQKYPIL